MSKIRADQFETVDGTGTGVITFEYGPGLVIRNHNTEVRDGNFVYRLDSSVTLPYTTTGAGLPEGGNFIGGTLDAVGPVDVRAYGAKGDGVTNDTQAIQNCLNNEKYVLFDNGRYMIDASSISIPNDRILKWENTASVKLLPTTAGTHAAFPMYGTRNVTFINPIIIGERYEHLGSSGEWGYGIDMRGTSDIKVIGGHISEFWADGIYLSGGLDFRPCRNILLEDVVCSDNRRQGITVSNVDGFYANRCIFENTSGIAPAAGVDLEPDNPEDQLKNVVFNSCISRNNEGSGFGQYFEWTSSVENQHIDITYINCSSVGNNSGFAFGRYSKSGYGSIKVVNCTSIDNQNNLSINGWYKEAPSLIIDDCDFIDNANTTNTHINIRNSYGDVNDIGSVFINYADYHSNDLNFDDITIDDSNSTSDVDVRINVLNRYPRINASDRVKSLIRVNGSYFSNPNTTPAPNSDGKLSTSWLDLSSIGVHYKPNIEPVIESDFCSNVHRAYTEFGPTNLTITDMWAVTRPQTGSYIDPYGASQSSNIDTPRITYDGGVCEGLIVDSAVNENVASSTTIPKISSDNGTILVTGTFNSGDLILQSGDYKIYADKTGVGTYTDVYSSGNNFTELVENGTFDTDLSGWEDVYNKWTWEGGRARVGAAGAPADLGPLVQYVKADYKVMLSVDVEVISGQLRITVVDKSGNAQIVDVDQTGTLSLESDGILSVAFTRSGSFDGYIDNVSIGRFETKNPEVVENGTFDTDLSGWEDSSNKWTWEGGRARFGAVGTPTDYGPLVQYVNAGYKVMLSVDVEVISGQLYITVTDKNGNSQNVVADQTGTYYLVADSLQSISFSRVTSYGFDGYIDNVIVKTPYPNGNNITFGDGLYKRIAYYPKPLSIIDIEELKFCM